MNYDPALSPVALSQPTTTFPPAQQVEGRARQDSEVQEAHSRLGNYAIQGKGFQRVVASDEGGPIIQVRVKGVHWSYS